ncbi:hypothetical protein ACJBU6_08692 [Exserohilum turcicum]
MAEGEKGKERKGKGKKRKEKRLIHMVFVSLSLSLSPFHVPHTSSVSHVYHHLHTTFVQSMRIYKCFVFFYSPHRQSTVNPFLLGLVAYDAIFLPLPLFGYTLKQRSRYRKNTPHPIITIPLPFID